MRHLSSLRAAALLFALSGCATTDEAQSSAIDNLPDAAGLTLEIQGGAPEGLAVQGMVASEPAALTLSATPHMGDDLAAARERIAAVNQAVRAVFEHVAEVARTNGAPGPGESTVYGPVSRCVVPGACESGGTATLRLRVHRALASTWGFALEAQVGAEWRPVAAGWLRRGEVVRRGTGRIAVNLDNLRAAAPAYTGRGHLLGGFANGPVVKSLAYRLLGFTPDPSRWEATTAAFRGFKTAAGVTRVRVAAIDDLYGEPGSDDELGFGHAAYHPTIGGRAYAIVTNFTAGGVTHGDVPASDGGAPQYFLGRACYAPGQTTPAYKEWFLCLRGSGPRACIAANDGVGMAVAGAPGSTWQSACPAAPAELEPPDGPPAPTPEDASPETGEGEAGVAPEAPPANVEDVTPPAA